MSNTQTADQSKLPLLYCCSGAVGPAQLGNYVAQQIDRSHLAQWSNTMALSCGVPAHVQQAQSGRPVVAIDGCEQACVKHILSEKGVTPVVWHQMTKSYPFAEHFNIDTDRARADEVVQEIAKTLPPKAA